jgi:hypothetical protein
MAQVTRAITRIFNQEHYNNIVLEFKSSISERLLGVTKDPASIHALILEFLPTAHMSPSLAD